VQLHGVPYPQPYVIRAVGDQASLLTAISQSRYLQIYQAQAADPTIGVGWKLQADDEVRAPAYKGLLDLNFAKPLSSS
jgi:uncharacterized protein YlxW (UPF0749 family)